MNRFSQAAGVWRSLRARVLNLDPGNPWRVLWLALNGAFGTWSVAGLFPEWPLVAALTCALFLVFSGLELFLMRSLADRLEQRCICAETRARAAEELVKGLAREPGYSTRAAIESRRLRRNMN